MGEIRTLVQILKKEPPHTQTPRIASAPYAYILTFKNSTGQSTLHMNTRKRDHASTEENDAADQPRILEPCPLGCFTKNGKPSKHGASRCPQRKRQLEADTEPTITAETDAILPFASAPTTSNSSVMVPHPLTRLEVVSEQLVLDNLEDNLSQGSSDGDSLNTRSSRTQQQTSPQADLEGLDDINEVSDINENRDINEVNQPAVSETTPPSAASAPSNALIRRIDQLDDANKKEKWQKKPLEFDDDKRLQKFCKRRKKLKDALHDLGA